MNNIQSQLHKLGGLVLIILFLVLAILLPQPASAQNNDQKVDDATDTEIAHQDSVPEESLTAEQKAERRAERLLKNKAALKEKLDSAEEKRIIAKCKNAQKLLASHQKRFDTLQTNRTKVYEDVSDRLDTIVERLDAAGIDITELKSLVEEYDTMVHDFSELTTAHSASVGDLGELDCTSDPEAFKATLEAARAEWKTMHEVAKSIRTYLIETIKPELLAAKDSLVSEDSDSSDSAADDSSTPSESETENEENVSEESPATEGTRE